MEHIRKTYGNDPLFSDFSLTVRSPGIYALCGESGVGKTTLLHMIAGLVCPDGGRIHAEGKISLMFQEHRLFPGETVLKNLLLSCFSAPAKEDENRAHDLLSELGFSDEDMAKYPDMLSGGMARRVAFARALLFPSDILLLDEPTKELDEDNRKKMLSLVTDAARTRIVLLVTHRESDVEDLGAKEILLTKDALRSPVTFDFA